MAGEPLRIHTSDRILYRRCRRKWDFSSRLRKNLRPVGESVSALWFGSAFHFALEDFHGWKRFEDPADALRAYAEAFPMSERPSDWKELIELGEGMLAYYQTWLSSRLGFRTMWLNGHPQVEVEFEIPLPISGPNGEQVLYGGTFDRVVIDPHGRLWILDYKTVRAIDTTKLETDPQITAYCWAAEQLYGRPVEGVVYMQFLKAKPAGPRILLDGTVSVNKNQRTTRILYRQALIDLYGDVQKAPAKNIAFLNQLAEQETEEGDAFIRRDLVYRNQSFTRAEMVKIMAEATEMLDPSLPIYPNPTRDCIWDCQFRTVCLAMDDGSDWEYLLDNEFEHRKEANTEWRTRIKWPANPQPSRPH